MAEKKTIYLFQRHLLTTGAVLRGEFFDSNNGHTRIPPYQRIYNRIRDLKGANINIKEARAVSQELRPDLDELEPILRRYSELPPDADLTLVDGESERGKEIGERLLSSPNLEGRQIEIAETSPFLRARNTAEVVLDGADSHLEKGLQINPDLREKQNGRRVEKVAYRQIDLAQHPEDLVRWSREGDNYKSPGDGAESEREFRKRVEKTLKRMRTSRKDEGKVVYLSTHSEFIGELIEQMNGRSRDINTGSITFIKAQPRTFIQRVTFRPRQLFVGETVNFVPRHYPSETQ